MAPGAVDHVFYVLLTTALILIVALSCLPVTSAKDTFVEMSGGQLDLDDEPTSTTAVAAEHTVCFLSRRPRNGI